MIIFAVLDRLLCLPYTEFWDRGDGEVGQTATSNGGRETDLVRQGSATPGGSSNNLEQYM